MNLAGHDGVVKPDSYLPMNHTVTCFQLLDVYFLRVKLWTKAEYLIVVSGSIACWRLLL